MHNLRVIRVDNVRWDRSLHSKVPNLYVQVCLGGTVSRKTCAIKSEPYSWNETFSFPTADTSEALSIKVLHRSAIPFRADLCIGSINVNFDDLFIRSTNGPTHLSLDAPPGKDYGKPSLLVRLLSASNSPVDLEPDVDKAIQAARGLERTNTLSLLNDDSNLGKSVLSLVQKIGILFNVIDKLSNLHPYLSVAWQLASSLHKAILHQIETDQKLIELVHAMEDAFDFVTDAGSLPDKTKRLNNTLEKLLQQTIECCHFTMHYTSRNFPARMLQTSRSKIDELTERFVDLTRALDADVGLHTAFVSARISDEVEDIYFRELLDPFDMNAFNRNICLEDTRVEVLNEIMDWLLSDTPQNILWLHGVAGSGKSTIATTVAEYCRDMSRLGAFIFFRRADGTEGQLVSLFRTIAFRLVMFDSCIAARVKAAVKKNDHITEAVAEVQFKRLLLEPLTVARDEIRGPVVIVLDALDECGTPEARRRLMLLLRREFGKLPPHFRFLITSRPEADINAALSPNANNSVHELALDSGSENSRRDVLRYIDHEISIIFEDVGLEMPDDWSMYRKRLADGSQGLFIWASTAIKLIKDNPSPFEELEGIAGKSHLLSGLEQLYESVLRRSGAVSDRYPSSITRFSQILGLILLSNTPLSDITIDAILGLSAAHSSRLILSKLQSVIAFIPGQPVHLFHTSFADYLLSTPCPKSCCIHQTPSECLSGPWFIDKLSQQTHIATRCFIVMKDMLHFNMCDLESSFTYNKGVVGFKDRVIDKIPLHLQYACKFWALHLTESQYSHKLSDELTELAHKRLLYWFEAVSLLGQAGRIASRALLDAALWSEIHNTGISSFLKDASRLTSIFSMSMTECTPQIYVSMLPLMKGESQVAAHYSKQTSRMVEVHRIGTKRPPLWLKVLEGHSDIVWSVAVSPDGKHVASGCNDGTVRIWDIESGETAYHLFNENRAAVTSVAFSTDGRYIVSGCLDATVSVWDIELGEVVSGPFEGHTGGVWAVAFSPTGTQVASGSQDTTIRVWGIEDRPTVKVLEGHTKVVRSVVFSPDGERIVSGSWDMTLRVWDTETGQTIGEPFVGHTDKIYSVAISPDARHVVSGSNDRSLRIWDMDSRSAVGDPLCHSGSVMSVAFSPDGKRILSGCADDSIVVWDMDDGEVVSGPFAGHGDSVRSVAFTPDGLHFISGSLDHTVRVWNASIGKIGVDSSTRHTGVVFSVTFSPNGRYIASGSRDKTIRLWDVSTGEQAIAPFEGHTHDVNSVAFSPDSQRLVSGSADRTVIVWDVERGKAAFKPLKGHTDTVISVAYSPDGVRIVSGSFDRTIIIWDANNGQLTIQFEQVHKTNIRTVAFSPNGTLIASASVDNDVILWNAESGEIVSGPLKAPQDSTDRYFAPVAFAPDGSCIASRNLDNEVVLRDVRSGQIVCGPLKGHVNTVMSIAFSPDGRYVVSGSYDRTLIIRDASNGNVISRPYEGHSSSITGVAFSPDSSRVVSCSFDGTIRIWVVPDKGGTISSPIEEALSDGVVASSFSTDGANEGFATWTLADNGWVLGSRGELLLWLPPDIRPALWRPLNTAVLSCEFSTMLGISNAAYGQHWQECFKPVA